MVEQFVLGLQCGASWGAWALGILVASLAFFFVVALVMSIFSGILAILGIAPKAQEQGAQAQDKVEPGEPGA